RAFFQIAPHQQSETAGELCHANERAWRRVRLLFKTAIHRLRPADLVDHAGAERADVAGDRLAAWRRKEIKTGARPQRAVFDDRGELAPISDRVLLGELGNFVVDRLGDLLGDQAPGVEREIDQQGGRIEGKNNEINERETERRRADELTERRHGSCPPRRAPYVRAAARSPCRSWSVAAKYAHR